MRRVTYDLSIKHEFIKSLVPHAGLDPASRDPRENWIPAFAGMTPLPTVDVHTIIDPLVTQCAIGQ